MTTNLHLDFLRVTEAAALAASFWVGRGDKNLADDAACTPMRRELADLPMRGRIVIGEGEMDEAPMLYIGEEVGSGEGPPVQIAVDPIDGTKLCARGLPGAVAVLAAAIDEEGALLHAPDCYMHKIVVGAECVGVIDLDASPQDNVRAIAKARGKDVREVTVGLLDRPRHEELMAGIREVGARVNLVSDGDVTLSIAALDPDSGVDALMGIGGAPEGVITAAAARCWGGEMQARLAPDDDATWERARQMLGGDPLRKLSTEDMARGSVMFSATGITTGELLSGVRFGRDYAKLASLVMRTASRTVRRVESMYRIEDLIQGQSL